HVAEGGGESLAVAWGAGNPAAQSPGNVDDRDVPFLRAPSRMSELRYSARLPQGPARADLPSLRSPDGPARILLRVRRPARLFRRRHPTRRGGGTPPVPGRPGHAVGPGRRAPLRR